MWATLSAVLRGPYSLRTHLLLYGAIVAMPLLLVGAWLLVGSAHQERERMEAMMARIVHDLASDIDRDIERRLALLRVLATSRALAKADWADFHEQARDAVADDGFLILIDPSLRQLVNTYLPHGRQPEITGDPDTARAMLATKHPQVSHLFVARVTGKPVFNINYPVLANGEVRYILILVLNPDVLLPILQAQTLNERWFSLVVDQNDRIVARYPVEGDSVGSHLPARIARDFRPGVRRTAVLDESGPVFRAVAPLQTAPGGSRSRSP